MVGCHGQLVTVVGDGVLIRRLGMLVESIHAVVYFAPEPQAAYGELGLTGYWRGSRAGPRRSARSGRRW